ncbi:MAG TPA: DNA polymerase III subunit delta [Solirubrobacteraceae bacterium]|nr:DNA polymerase III subunit delta [Solirubrobacteraceae bacterium]
MAPAFKTAYLIHGDDHGRIAERRAGLRELAESSSGAQGLELFEGDQATPDNVAAALNAMTFAIGRRFIIVDGAERWKDKEMDAMEAALGAITPDTTVTFFAREDGRLKAPKRLHDAVKKAGGVIATEQSVKPWELPKWVVAQARQLGLELTPEAARMLVGHVGERQQRLLRELEKLALELGPQTTIDADMVLELTAASAERKAWVLADALLSGNAATATRMLLQMRAQGERLPGLIYWMSSRVRQAHQIARDLDRGVSQAQVKSGLRMPPSAADKLIADAKRIGAERLERAICLIADLELASRGGSSGSASEDTEALLTIYEIAA